MKNHLNTFLVGGSNTPFIQVLRINDQKVDKANFHGETDFVYCLKNIRDWAVSAGASKVIKIWDVEKLNSVMDLAGHHSEIYDIEVQDENVFFSSSADHNLITWDIREKKQVSQLKLKGITRNIQLKNGKLNFCDEHGNIFLDGNFRNDLKIHNKLQSLCLFDDQYTFFGGHSKLLHCFDRINNKIIDFHVEQN